MKLFIANMRGFILMDLEGLRDSNKKTRDQKARRTRRRMTVNVAVRCRCFIKVFGVWGQSTLEAFSELDDDGAVNEQLAL